MKEEPFEQHLSWARRHMPYLHRQATLLPDLAGVRLACSIHLDLKLVPLLEALVDHGARLFLTSCNAMTTRDQVVRHMIERGAEARAVHGMSPAQSAAASAAALEWEPTHFCEMGAALSTAWHRASGPRPPIRAGLEATGSGIRLLEELELGYPVFNWDDLPVKEGLHNRHMVGLTLWQAFFSATRLTLHEKAVLVVGYGSVGRGVAHAARAFGGTVTIVELDPGRALEAAYAGWPVSTLEEALPHADVVVTATGRPRIIAEDHLEQVKDGCFLMNVGHVDHEIDREALYALQHKQVLPHVEEIQHGDRTFYLFAGGGMANLAAGEGDSLNAFDVTLAVLAAAIGFMVEHGSRFPPGLHLLPQEVWKAAVTSPMSGLET